MKTMYDVLKSYFDNTSDVDAKKTWDSVSEFDNVESPYVLDFIETTLYYNLIDTGPELENNFFKTIENPNFSSDFLFIKQIKWNQQVFQ